MRKKVEKVQREENRNDRLIGNITDGGKEKEKKWKRNYGK